MAFTFIVILALAAFANGGLIPESTTVVKSGDAVVETVEHVVAKEPEDYDAHPQYKYAYDVEDSVSGDSKSQVEEREGDVVRGQYSLDDADGFRRTVQYTADPVNGFQADVRREPIVKTVVPGVVPTVVKSVAPIATYATPAVVKTVTPEVHYTAPVTQYTHSSVVSPAVTSYAAPSLVRTVGPVAHYSHVPTVYTSYSGPTTTYFTHY